MKLTETKQVFIALFLLWFPVQSVVNLVCAQNPIIGNPSDYNAPEAAFSNPALGPYHMDRLNIGIRALHWGATGNAFGLHEEFVSYSFPPLIRGASVLANSFSSSLMSQRWFRFQYGRPLSRWFSIGAGLGMINRSWKSEAFNLEDENDPVFRNGSGLTVPDFSIGLLFLPSFGLRLGAVLHQLNRPDISLQSINARVPMLLSTGALWDLKYFQISLALLGFEIHELDVDQLTKSYEEEKYKVQAGIEIPVGDLGSLKFQGSNRQFSIDLKVKIRPTMEFLYQFDSPLGDMAEYTFISHRTGLVMKFFHLPQLPRRLPPSGLPVVRFTGGLRPAVHQRLLTAHGNADSVQIYTQTIRRSVDDLIPIEALNATASSLAYIDTSGIRQPLDPSIAHRFSVTDPNLGMRGLYTTKYMASMEYIGQQLKRTPELQVQMLLPPGDERRANELANLLTGSWRIHDEKNVNLFQVGSHDVNLDSLEEAEWRKISVYAQTTTPLPDSLQIRILPINPAPTGFEWRLNIYNEKDKAIHKWYGHGHPPEQIIWDWKLSDGTFVGTGNYCYYIQWVDEDGVWRRSFRQYFQIKHIRKLHSFDVTQKPKHLDHGVEEFRLILGAGKKKRINDK